MVIVFVILNTDNAFAIQCPKGQFPVRSHHRNAYIKTDGTNVSATNVKEQCRPYRVQVKPEPKFISTTPKNWPNPNEKFRNWTKDEKAKVLAVLKNLPKSLTYIGEIIFLRSMEKSSNPSVSNSENQIIVLYDSVTSHDLKRVLSHELAHIYWDSLDYNIREEYYHTAEWIIDRDKKTISLQRKDVFISDSYIGPHEDFSNSVELFIQNKDTFNKYPKLLGCLEKFLQ